MKDLPTKIATFKVPGEGLKGQVGVLLGSSWALKGILRHLTIILPAEVNLRGGGALFPGLCRARGGPGGRGKGMGID